MMKNQRQNEVHPQVSTLRKQFRFIDQYYIRILYEFCEYEISRTYKILTILKQDPSPLGFIKYLVQNPAMSEKAILDMQKQYNKKYPTYDSQRIEFNLSECELDQKNDKTEIHQSGDSPQYDFFELVPPDICLKIMSFLDPLSFSKISCVNSHFYRYSKSEQAHQYFKALCMNQFEFNQPKLPTNCVFEQIKYYVLTHPLEFGQNCRNAVNNNLRYFVWKMEATSFKIEKEYYKLFGDYRNLFLTCPRIHFNGYYICRQKYVKVGEKNYMNMITPIHIIYFYRYIRFFEDGSLLYYVSNKKHSPQQILSRLSSQQRSNFDPDNEDEVMIGQFMEYKDKVYFKAAKKNTIFSFQINVESTDNKISDKLNIHRYTLQVVDEKELIQVLFLKKPYKEELYFNYYSNLEVETQNTSSRAKCGM